MSAKKSKGAPPSVDMLSSPAPPATSKKSILAKGKKKGEGEMGSHQKKLVVTQTKGEILGKAFSYLSALIVMGTVALIGYYNYVILIALIVAIPMGEVRDRMSEAVLWVEHVGGKVYATRKFAAAYIFLTLCLIGAVWWFPFLFTALFCVWSISLVCLITLTWSARRDAILTVFLMIVTFLLFVFPIFFIVKNCFTESINLSNKISNIVKEDKDIQDLITNYNQSRIYIKFRDYVEGWGWDMSEVDSSWVREQLLKVASLVGTHMNYFFGSAYSLITNIGSFLLSFIIFMTCLFYFVESKDQFWKFIGEVSPFAPAEHQQLIGALFGSVSRILLSSFLIGMTHFFTTFVSFWYARIDLIYISAALSAFLSMFPLISSWVIWLPVTAFLLYTGRIHDSLAVAVPHIFATYVLDSIIFTYIPGDTTYVGLSVFLGIGAFGISGAILGPLLAGIMGAILTMYKGYYLKPPAQHNGNTTALRPRTLSGDFTDYTTPARRGGVRRVIGFD